MPLRSFLTFCLTVACTLAAIGVVNDLFDLEQVRRSASRLESPDDLGLCRPLDTGYPQTNTEAAGLAGHCTSRLDFRRGPAVSRAA